MQAAVVFLWAGCLWSMVRGILHLVLAASLWRRLLVLVVLALTVSSAHQPRETSRDKYVPSVQVDGQK